MSTEIEYNGSIVATVEGGNTATLPVAGTKMATDIVVTVSETAIPALLSGTWLIDSDKLYNLLLEDRDNVAQSLNFSAGVAGSDAGLIYYTSMNFDFGTKALSYSGDSGTNSFSNYNYSAYGDGWKEYPDGDNGATINIDEEQAVSTDFYLLFTSVATKENDINNRITELEIRVSALEDSVAELLYKPIEIATLTNNVRTAEMGSTVTAVTLSWALNKEAESVTLDGEAQATGTSGSKALTGLRITSNKTWTLEATDERGATATKTTSITFLNGIYYGAGATFDISALTKTLSNTKGRTFTADAGEGEYLWYVLPTRLGTCTFKVGGFDGGFSLLSTASVTNASGYAEEYYIYRSDNASLGSTTVVVS